MNPIHPDYLTTKERLGEFCRLLALGLLRLRVRDHAPARQSSDLPITAERVRWSEPKEVH